MNLNDPLQYYTAPGLLADPGEHADLLAGLPADIPSLVRIVQHNFVHIFWAESYGLHLTEEQKETVNVRSISGKLGRIRQVDSRPLVEPRPLEKRQANNCRDFSLFLCSLLQQQGIPARSRCGFGAYFIPGRYEDHWVCEYWNTAKERWVMVDAQLDQHQQEVLKIDFDPLDVPRDRFILAGDAWGMARRGDADPDLFGIFEYKGLLFILGNVVRDFLALNKIELLPWDWGWGLMDYPDEETALQMVDYPVVDRIAELTLFGNEVFEEVRAVYGREARLHPPPDLLVG